MCLESMAGRTNKEWIEPVLSEEKERNFGRRKRSITEGNGKVCEKGMVVSLS